jgi:hypothetical protein
MNGLWLLLHQAALGGGGRGGVFVNPLLRKLVGHSDLANCDGFNSVTLAVSDMVQSANSTPECS